MNQYKRIDFGQYAFGIYILKSLNLFKIAFWQPVILIFFVTLQRKRSDNGSKSRILYKQIFELHVTFLS